MATETQPDQSIASSSAENSSPAVSGDGKVVVFLFILGFFLLGSMILGELILKLFF